MMKKKNTGERHPGQERVYFLLQLSQAQKKVKAGTESKAAEECRLRASIAIFLIQQKPTCLGMYCSQWARLSHINKQSHLCSIDMSTGQSDGGNSSAETPSSHVNLVCV